VHHWEMPPFFGTQALTTPSNKHTGD
jgi:hypothetical protein